MKIERPNSAPPSLEDLKNLDKLKKIIERATADGVITKEEMDTIKVVISADRQISPQELELCQQLIWCKITQGKLDYDWD